MITIEQAQAIILDTVQLLAAEEVSLLTALGRITAEELHAPWDIPLADYSAMDGYAFAAASGTVLAVAGFLPAGGSHETPVPQGSAVKIMTGAMIPTGCDTVVPIEDVELLADGISIRGRVTPGMNIRLKGEDVIKGELVIQAGTLLRPAEIGMITSLGRTSVSVVRTLQAAILSTGDELLDAGATPRPGQVLNSNSYTIAAQVMESGACPVMLGIARDNREDTRRKLEEGLAADILITTGGVSVGDRDLVKEILSTGNQSSGRISSLTRSNGLMMLPPDTTFSAGDEVDVQLLDRSFEMGTLTS